jgi:FAD/FMN-containing dehydrogenase
LNFSPEEEDRMNKQEIATDPLKLEIGSGEVIRPGDDGYDEARSVFNAMIDKRPALIVRPTTAAEVAEAVNLARERGLPLAVRCGGHSVSGMGTCDDGILINLSLMKGVAVDTAARTARVNAGVLAGELDRDTQVFGLATPGGRVTTTGVGGFTLGGGYGWLSPKYGLACDNLVSVDVVTDDGRLVRASASENEDLFWGVRGGSSNFGVVTSYEFCLHPVGPVLLGGMVIHPIAEAKERLCAWRDYIEQAPEELSTAAAIFIAPPEPFVPDELQGKHVLGMLAMYIGDPDDGADVVRPIKELGPPAVDMIEPMPYTAFQEILDPTAPWGTQVYNSGEHIRELSDEAIDTFVEHAGELDAPLSQAIMFRHGGAVSRVPEDAMAAGHRDAAYMMHPIAVWDDPADSERHISWCRGLCRAMRPYTTGGVYLNMVMDEGENRVRDGYGSEKYRRLVALKDRYDPGNLFSVNQNIKPSRETVAGATA